MDLVADLKKQGFVHLKRFFPEEMITTIRERTGAMIDHRDDDFFWGYMPPGAQQAAREGRILPDAYGAGFFEPLQLLKPLLDQSLKNWTFQCRDTINLMPMPNHDTSTASYGIGWHTDGMYYDDLHMAITAWIPLDQCGVDSPGLALACAGPDEIRQYLSFNPGAPQAPIPQFWPDNAFRYGPNLIQQLNDDSVSRAFETVTPTFERGDLAFFTSWCLHATLRRPEMIKPRAAMQLRFVGQTADLA